MLKLQVKSVKNGFLCRYFVVQFLMGCLLIQTEAIQQPGKFIALHSKYILRGVGPSEPILFQSFLPEAIMPMF